MRWHNAPGPAEAGPGALCRYERERSKRTATGRSGSAELVAEGIATGTVAMVVQEVPVDGLTETGIRRAAGGTSDDALDDHASRRAEQHTDGRHPSVSRMNRTAGVTAQIGDVDLKSLGMNGSNGGCMRGWLYPAGTKKTVP